MNTTIRDLPAPRPEAGTQTTGQLPCRRHPELFFSDLAADVDRAKAECASCPIVEACREHAISTREPFGVWGGTSEDDRRERARGRATRGA